MKRNAECERHSADGGLSLQPVVGEIGDKPQHDAAEDGGENGIETFVKLRLLRISHGGLGVAVRAPGFGAGSLERADIFSRCPVEGKRSRVKSARPNPYAQKQSDPLSGPDESESLGAPPFSKKRGARLSDGPDVSPDQEGLRRSAPCRSRLRCPFPWTCRTSERRPSCRGRCP